MEQNKYLDIVCQVMNAAMKGEHLDLSDYVNDKEFLRIMEEQTFQPFLYKVDKRPEFRKYYIQASLINDKFDKIGNKIKEIFDANNIDHIFLKGFELKKLYPDPCIRQMGDIDVLVREEDHEKAISLLEKEGFVRGEKQSHHVDMKYKGIEIEIHNKLLDYDNGFNKIIQYPFECIDANNTFLFLLAHYIKHLKNGAGLREICDLYLFLNFNNINLDFIKKQLSLTKCESFLDTLLSLINHIFKKKFINYEHNPYTLEIISFCLQSGIHGFANLDKRMETIYIRKKENKFIFLLKKLFIPIPELFKKYPWTKSILLIPFGYCFRLVHLIVNKKDMLNIVLKTNKKDNILDKMGIK